MTSNQTDQFSKQRAMSLVEFVNSLFEFAKSPKRSGLFVLMDSGNNTHIEICPIDENTIIVLMDGVDMGCFKTMEERGYKCSFHQKNRPSIKMGLTENESMMKSICNHPLIAFYEA